MAILIFSCTITNGQTFDIPVPEKHIFLSQSHEKSEASLLDSIASFKKKGDTANEIKYRVFYAELEVAFGKFEQADNILKSNQSLIVKAFGDSSLLLAANYIVQSKLYQLLEEWKQVKTSVDNSVRIKKQNQLPEKEFAKDFNQYVWYYQSTQNHDSALYYAKRAVVLSKRTENPNKPYLLAESYNNLAYSYHYNPQSYYHFQKNYFREYTDSAQMILNTQPLKDQLLQARLHHNKGNHYASFDYSLDYPLDSVLSQYDRSLEIYNHFDNPYYAALNQFVRAYNTALYSNHIQNEEKIKYLKLALNNYYEGMGILTSDTLQPNEFPSISKSSIDNLYILFIRRIENLYSLLYKESREEKYLDFAYVYSYYHTIFQATKINADISDKSDLVYYSSHGGGLGNMGFISYSYDKFLRTKDSLLIKRAIKDASGVKSYYLKSKILGESSASETTPQTSPNSGTATIEYFTSAGNIFAIVRTQKSSNLIKIQYLREDLMWGDILSLRELNGEDYKQKSKEIFNAVLSPCLELMDDDIKEIVIMPEIYTVLIPFDALNMGTVDNPTYVVEKYNIRYDLSFELLNFHLSTEISNGQTLIVSPDFEDNSDLPFSKKLTEKLAKDYQSNFLNNSKVTKANIISNLKKARILHLSTHVKSSEVQYQNEILLSGDRFTYYDLAQVDLSNLQLAVLHGCKTNYGKYVSGLTGLGAEFMKYGANSVVQTLWDVDDFYSSELLSKFYKYLDKGQTTSEALRSAKLWMLKESPQKEYKNPMNWAGFVLYGGDHQIELPKRTNYWYLMLLLLIPVAFIGYRKIR